MDWLALARRRRSCLRQGRTWIIPTGFLAVSAQVPISLMAAMLPDAAFAVVCVLVPPRIGAEYWFGEQ